MSRALLIQLARLGDLVQSLPVLTSLRTVYPEQALDLLCPSPLVSLGELFPCVDRVYPWKGEEWHALATTSMTKCDQRLVQAKGYLSQFADSTYSLAYNLNNHPRGILAAHLLSDRVVGPGQKGPLNPTLPSWAGYLREVAQNRGNNRVHLADAFCGLCQVFPPSDIPSLQALEVPLPLELERVVNAHTSMLVGIVLGAGDTDRRVPLYVWQDFISKCAERIPESYLLIIGGEGEREAALTLERYLPAKYMNRVVNACGRTTLPQLVGILNRCRWVVGSDTGPLHLGAMCGARVIGWYFSRARVHETGPYGVGHYVWQKWESQSLNSQEEHEARTASTLSEDWPVRETVELIREGQVDFRQAGWDLWTSHRDDWGMFYSRAVKPDEAVHRRKDTWKALSRLMADDVQVEVLR